MSDTHFSFESLSFSSLFCSYTKDFESLSSFYNGNPFSEAEILKKMDGHRSGIKKKGYIRALKTYHEELGITEHQKEALEKLSADDATAVVTGQQLGIGGGPLFTIYKTITAIRYARKLEDSSGRPVVPVFWLGDEDHDFDEIAWVGVPGYDTYHQIKLDAADNGKTVAEQIVPENMDQLFHQVFERLPETDFSDKLRDLLLDCYQPGNTFARAFAKLISFLFPDQGLLIAGSNQKHIKELTADFFTHAVKQNQRINQKLKQQSDKIAAIFHQQVQLGSSNLFYLHPEKGRLKMDADPQGHWLIGEKQFSEQEILELVESNPERFSPNVFLRPVLQDYLLPTISYVAGPGELAYYAQMKEIYPDFGVEMPVITPRLSATLLESSTARNMDKLPFSLPEYNQRIEDLESEYIEDSDTPDPETIFGPWKEELEKISEKPVKEIGKIEKTLEPAADKFVTGITNEMNKLKGKVYRAIKQQEQVQLDRISRTQSQLFPDGLQERSVSPIFFMNKYGLDLPSKLSELFEGEHLDLTHHHVFRL